jgi:hypothetical protein
MTSKTDLGGCLEEKQVGLLGVCLRLFSQHLPRVFVVGQSWRGRRCGLLILLGVGFGIGLLALGRFRWCSSLCRRVRDQVELLVSCVMTESIRELTLLPTRQMTMFGFACLCSSFTQAFAFSSEACDFSCVTSGAVQGSSQLW